MWTYHWFSEKLGWTPRQVDELTLEEAHWLPLLADAKNAAAIQLTPDN